MTRDQENTGDVGESTVPGAIIPDGSMRAENDSYLQWELHKQKRAVLVAVTAVMQM
jgi:hypothetical protein